MSTLEHRLRAIDEALAAGDLPAAREALARALELDRDHPDVVYAQACVEWEADGPEAASRSLTRTLEIDPSHADAHYGLARVLELQGDRPAMIQHLLRVHALDARADRAARIGGRRDLDHVEGVARDVLSALPGPFAERLRHVPVILEARPSRALVARRRRRRDSNVAAAASTCCLSSSCRVYAS